MDRAQVRAEIANIIRDVIDEPDMEIDDATTAQLVEGWDSFNHINIVVGVEAHFAIKFKTAEVEDLKNVGEFVSLVLGRIAAREPR